MPILSVIRELGKLLGVIVVVAGCGLGVAALVDGGDDERRSTAGAPTTTEGAGAGATSGATGAVLGARAESPAPATDPRVRVRGATLFSATTQRGRARNRARLVLAVRVDNRAGRAPVFLWPQLQLPGGVVVQADPRAPDAVEGPALRGRSVAGILSFELAGEQTTVVRRELRAQLRVAGIELETDVVLGQPASPAG